MLNPDFRDMLSVLNEERVEYLVVGAYALAAHGLPRATGDLDLWIRPSRENVSRLFSALEEFGTPVDSFSEEDFAKPDVLFRIGREPRRIDFLTSVTALEFEDAWVRRLTTEVDGIEVNLVGLEDFLHNKRATGREKDRVDADELERTRGENPEQSD